MSDFFNGIGQFTRDTWAELHRVQWPTKDTVRNHTIVVLMTILFIALYVGGLDALLTYVFKNIFHVGGG